MAQKSRYWITVVYPESAAENWIEILNLSGLQAIISPLHDKDVTAVGDVKKPHYHVMLMWDGPTTKKCAQEWIEQIGGVGCFIAASPRGCARYWCHLDNPDKAQYSREDVTCIGGVDYDDLVNQVSDEILILRQIFDFCEDYKITSYRKLMIYCRYHEPAWEKAIITKYRENVFRYLRSFENDLKQGDKSSIDDVLDDIYKKIDNKLEEYRKAHKCVDNTPE